VVIDDCRHVNEAAHFLDNPSAYVIKIENPERVSEADPNHPSELEVDMVPSDYIDFTITNLPSEGLEALHQKLDGILRKIGL
jgi:hypothetical protein